MYSDAEVKCWNPLGRQNMRSVWLLCAKSTTVRVLRCLRAKTRGKKASKIFAEWTSPLTMFRPTPFCCDELREREGEWLPRGDGEGVAEGLREVNGDAFQDADGDALLEAEAAEANFTLFAG